MEKHGNVAVLSDDIKIEFNKNGSVVSRIGLLDLNLCLSQGEPFVVKKESYIHTNSSSFYEEKNPVPKTISHYDTFKDVYSKLD